MVVVVMVKSKNSRCKTGVSWNLCRSCKSKSKSKAQKK